MSEAFHDIPAFPRNYEADGHNGMTLRERLVIGALPVVATILHACDTPEAAIIAFGDRAKKMGMRELLVDEAFAIADAVIARSRGA